MRRFQQTAGAIGRLPTPECGHPDPVSYTFCMTIVKILASIDSEIARLEEARALLSTDGTKKTAPRVTPKKRKMSTAARKRIGDAQRKRWARQKAGK